MITLLSPTTIEGVDEPARFVIEASRDVFHAMKAAVEVAFEDSDSIPEEYQDAAAQLWRFFNQGEVTTEDGGDGVAWTHHWACRCEPPKQRLRLAWTRCDDCGMTCPIPNGNDPWPS